MTPQADAVASLYRPMEHDGWIVRRWGNDIPLRGYWSPARPVSGVISLDRGSDTWMSLMPVEVESQQTGVDCASGHVAVFGLGHGWSAALCALKDEVEAVTVVECDSALIDLHRELDLFDRLPRGAGYTKDWPVERFMRDAKLLDIGAGTNEIRRMLIGRELIGAA